MKNLLNRNGWWSFRMKVEGRDKWVALGTQDEAAARDAAALLRQTAQNERMRQRLGMAPAVSDNLLQKLGMLRQRSDSATIAEVLLAFDEANRSRANVPASARNAKISLRHIVRVVQGETFDVDAAKCSILTDELLSDYAAERTRQRKEVEIPATMARLAKAGRPVTSEREFIDHEMSAIQTTIKSTVQQARSIFAKELLQSAPYRMLKLPDLTSFRGKKLDGTTLKRYRRPDLTVLQRIRDSAAALKQSDPGAWLALQLEANGGLRRGSAADALWDWFVITGPETVQLECRRAKGGTTNNAFPWDRYKEMLELKDSPAFVLPGATREERDDCCERLKTWLRACGMDRRLPNHELRKWAVDTRRREHGKDDASNFAGHSDHKLLVAYSQGSTEKVLRVV